MEMRNCWKDINLERLIEDKVNWLRSRPQGKLVLSRLPDVCGELVRLQVRYEKTDEPLASLFRCAAFPDAICILRPDFGQA